MSPSDLRPPPACSFLKQERWRKVAGWAGECVLCPTSHTCAAWRLVIELKAPRRHESKSRETVLPGIQHLTTDLRASGPNSSGLFPKQQTAHPGNLWSNSGSFSSGLRQQKSNEFYFPKKLNLGKPITSLSNLCQYLKLLSSWTYPFVTCH